MREHVRNVSATNVTIIVQDTQSFQQQMAVVGKVVEWVKEARICLTDAIAYTTLAMTRPDLVHPIYWASLDYYFGIPLSDPTDGHYDSSINTIRNALIITSNGLNGDFTVSDIHEISGVYGMLFRAGKSDLKNEMGVVHRDIAEELGNMARGMFGLPSPRNTGPEQRESHIYLNFEQLMAMKPWWGVVALIHEATHKYARTIDAQYFNSDDGDMWQRYEEATKDLKEMRTLLGVEDPFTGLMQEAKKMVSSRLGHDAIANIRAMSRADALNNADGLSRYAHSVFNFPAWH